MQEYNNLFNDQNLEQLHEAAIKRSKLSMIGDEIVCLDASQAYDSSEEEKEKGPVQPPHDLESIVDQVGKN
jgi:hypothetical protein